VPGGHDERRLVELLEPRQDGLTAVAEILNALHVVADERWRDPIG
jgi:hypothetical protein